MPFKWTCPYCNRPTTVGDSDYSLKVFDFTHLSPDNEAVDSVTARAIQCPNPACNRLAVTVNLATKRWKSGAYVYDKVKGRQMMPDGSAKPFPDYIPQGIRDDYVEARLVLENSPKAAAALARRCLQGMIRDFWGVTNKPSLYQEIEAIKDRVDPLTWKAIDAVRSVGNIGAHMEKDVNLIVDVDPGEADQLIALIETLLVEWYIHRHERELQMAALVAVAEKKKALRTGADDTAPPTSTT